MRSVAPEDEANTDYDDMLSHDLDVMRDDNQHKLSNGTSQSPPPLLRRYGSRGAEDFSQLIDSETGQAPHPFTAFHGKGVAKSIAAFPAADAGPGRAVILVLRGGGGRQRLVQYTNIPPPEKKVGHNEEKDTGQEGSKGISIRISTSSDQGDGESKNGGKATAQPVLVRGKGARVGVGAAAWVKTDKSDVSAHNIAARVGPLLAKDAIAIAAHPRSNSLFFLRGSSWKVRGIHRRNQSVHRINLATLEVTSCLSGLECVLSLAVHPDGALFILQTTNGWSQLSEIWRYALTGSGEKQQQQQQQHEEERGAQKTCPQGHALSAHTTEGGLGTCDGCSQDLAHGTNVMDCTACDYFLCNSCDPRTSSTSPSPRSSSSPYEDTGTLVMNELGDSSKFLFPPPPLP